MIPNVCFLALKIMNASGTEILVRRFAAAKVWSLPVVETNDADIDPYTLLPKALKEIIVSPNFVFIAATPLIKYDHTERVYDEKVAAHVPKIYRSYIYSLQYKGNVSPVLPHTVRSSYDRSRYTPVDKLKSLGFVNRPMDALIQASEKEPNLL